MEHISIEINKDFGGFKNNFCLGFTLTETLCILFATLCCGATVLPLCVLLHVDVFIAGYIGMIPTGLILFFGFYKKSGMDAKEYFAKSKALKKMKKLHYESEENPENIIMLMEEEKEKQERTDVKDTQDSWNLTITKYKKRAKIAFGAIVVTMFLCAAGMSSFHFVKNKELSKIKKSEISTEITKKESKETSKSSTEIMTTEKTVSTTKKEKKTETESRPSDSSTTARRSNSTETVTQRSETTQARTTTARRRTEAKTEKRRLTTEKRKSMTEKKKPTKPKPSKPTKPATEKPNKPNFNVDYNTD